MKLPFSKPASRPGPVARVRAAFTDLRALGVLALFVAVAAFVIAVVK
jgi:hypothetical protein